MSELPEIIRFTVPGTPVPKGRPRARIVTPHGKPQFISFYTPKETQVYETAVGWQAKAAMAGGRPFNESIEVSIIAFFCPPDSWSKKKKEEAIKGMFWPTSKPDIDNVAKLILDAINNIVFTDDSRICGLTCEKHYSTVPRVEVEVRRAVYIPF